jgi:[calcium/calmodulin-dependent protein kinase] kinase
LHQRKKDEKFYAIKILNKSRLSKLRVSPTETAMMDVQREVAIMKRLDHPNIVKLYEVIDDPESGRLYLVLEYAEGNWIFEGCGPPGGIGEALARKYFQDAVSGLSYLHSHNVIHGDIKPENLLISGDGSIKICDFGLSRMFEGGNDELQRSPGTPVYTAPECCSGLYYRGCPADIWALGCTLYCMVFGRYPFVGDTFPSVFDKIVNQPLFIPDGTNLDLADLLRGILCKDVGKRLSLAAIAIHPWLSCSYAQVQATCPKSAYEMPPPFGPPIGHQFVVHENGRVELESMV